MKLGYELFLLSLVLSRDHSWTTCVTSLPQWLVRYGETIITTCNITFRWFQDTSTELLPLENLISVLESETASATRLRLWWACIWCVRWISNTTCHFTSHQWPSGSMAAATPAIACFPSCWFNWSITVPRFKARSPNRLQIQVVFFESGRLFFLRYLFRDWFTLFLTNFISIVAPFLGDLPTTPSVTTLTCCVWRWGQRTSRTQRGYNCVEFDLFAITPG